MRRVQQLDVVFPCVNYECNRHVPHMVAELVELLLKTALMIFFFMARNDTKSVAGNANNKIYESANRTMFHCGKHALAKRVHIQRQWPYKYIN